MVRSLPNSPTTDNGLQQCYFLLTGTMLDWQPLHFPLINNQHGKNRNVFNGYGMSQAFSVAEEGVGILSQNTAKTTPNTFSALHPVLPCKPTCEEGIHLTF